MEVLRLGLSISTENNFKNPLCNLNTYYHSRHDASSAQVKFVVGVGFRGIGSFIKSEKLVDKLRIAEIGSRHGVLGKTGQLGFVNSQIGFVNTQLGFENRSSKFDSLNIDASTLLPPSSHSSSEFVSHDGATSSCSDSTHGPWLPLPGPEKLEEAIEKAIFNCRFFTLLAVAGSLAGSVLCFLKGCSFVIDSFKENLRSWIYGYEPRQVSLMLVKAIDVYLMGTVMLIFGLGLYELFVSSLQISDQTCTPQASRASTCASNFFGLFKLQERPKWLEIQSLNEMKTKLGQVIVMVLLVGMFEKCKTVPVNSALDLIFFSGSVLLSSSCLFLLSKLKSHK